MPRVGVCVVQGTGTLKPPAFHGTTTAIRRVQYIHRLHVLHTYYIHTFMSSNIYITCMNVTRLFHQMCPRRYVCMCAPSQGVQYT